MNVTCGECGPRLVYFVCDTCAAHCAMRPPKPCSKVSEAFCKARETSAPTVDGAGDKTRTVALRVEGRARIRGAGERGDGWSNDRGRVGHVWHCALCSL